MMKLLPPESPMLREIATPVGDPASKFGIMQDMIEFLRDIGVGLAAPQIGISERFFVIREGGRSLCCVNPSIEATEGTTWGWESCLSVPEANITLPRGARIRVQYWNEYGVKKRHWMTGLRARIFQHENDHLEGILIPRDQPT